MRPVKKSQPAYLTEAILSNSPVERATIQNALIEAIGNYCSYCEIPLGGYLIEHYRYLAYWKPVIGLKDWDDLLLICADCRSHIQKAVLSAEEAGAMLWPDLDVTFAVDDQSPFIYELRDVSLLKEDENGSPGAPEATSLVFVVANPLCDDETRKRAQNTIDHFQLNMPGKFYNPSTKELHLPYTYWQTVKDNRIFKRTQAWVDATAALARLRELDAYGAGAGTAIIGDLLREQIAVQAVYSGNWSVWVTVFNNASTDGITLRKLFTNEKRNFPGTDGATLFSQE